jgi:hypothetical protein
MPCLLVKLRIVFCAKGLARRADENQDVREKRGRKEGQERKGRSAFFGGDDGEGGGGQRQGARATTDLFTLGEVPVGCRCG